ncbi:MAG: HDOD domain-containing protein [Candidatus Sedimenticola sp. (ex Thyasira tokunagai)]
MFASDLLDNLLYDSLDSLTLPDVYIRLRQLMDSDEESMSDVAAVLSMDPALAARVLRIANSAFYGLPSKVDTVSRAASILGMKKLHDLTLAISVSKAVSNLPNDLMDLSTFWHRSVRCGFLAKQIAERAGLRDSESIFVRGLLHDIGHLILFRSHPDECREALAHSDQGLEARMKAEEEAIGVNGLQFTAELTRVWQLPQTFVDTYMHLLHPEEAEPPLAREIAMLNIAVQFINGEDSDLLEEEILKQIRPEIWHIAELQPDAGAAALDASAQEMSGAMYEIFKQ